MIRIPVQRTSSVLSVLALLILAGCGSSPDRVATPAPSYARTPVQAQPLQLSAGVAPAIARAGSGNSGPIDQATPAPAVATIEQETPVDVVSEISTEEPVVEQEPVAAEEPTIAEEPVVAEESVIIEEPVVIENTTIAEQPVVAE
ncbi:MAG: hypothetical protein HRU16_05095, partial [Planctomycetes bacterium]|nr:hypothetical protein [Planctomycetota bacterium]